MSKHRIFTTSFSSVYALYIKKVERKGKTKQEVDQVICWLTGYTQQQLDHQIALEVDFETFFKEAIDFNPNANLIQGKICGIAVQDIEDPLMQKIRYMDKLVDEVANGRKMEKILRSA